jgi:hypothetical protein
VQPPPFEGSARQPYQSRRRGVTGLAPTTPHSPSHSGGDGLPPGELVRRHRGTSPRRMMAPPRCCQGIKCPRTGAGACARSALERSGPRPRAERTLERGGARSREAHPLERGGARPREARVLERGEACSRGPSGGPPGGPLGPLWRGPCPAWLSKACLALAFLRVLSGDFPVV